MIRIHGKTVAGCPGPSNFGCSEISLAETPVAVGVAQCPQVGGGPAGFELARFTGTAVCITGTREGGGDRTTFLALNRCYCISNITGGNVKIVVGIKRRTVKDCPSRVRCISSSGNLGRILLVKPSIAVSVSRRARQHREGRPTAQELHRTTHTTVHRARRNIS